MFFPNKYDELNKKFKNFAAISLEGISPFHPIYTETLENIDQFINEIIFERRFRNRLSPAEKEKVIEAFIIPLYELKKTMYTRAIDYIQTHHHKNKDAMEEFNRQIHACDESIYDYRQASCVNNCAIL